MDDSPSSPPKSVSFDPGSSVSTNMIEEYEDLLRYAVVTPNYLDPASSKPQQHNKTVSNQPKATQTTNSITSEEQSSGNITLDGSDDVSRCESVGVSPAPLQPVVIPSSMKDKSISDDKDDDVTRLSDQLDQWCTDLKSNVMAEFLQTKLKFKEKLNSDMQTERAEHAKIVHDLSQDIRGKVELLRVYELSLTKKDEVIMSLTKSLHKQKQQVTMAKTMAMWKFCHMDKKREGFTERLAIKHRNCTIKSKIFRSWFGVIQGRWKNRVEKACQIRAEEVCHEVSKEYEDKLSSVNRAYEEALREISILKRSQSIYEENMKKAFMRGVCALNMEAMTMFHETTPTSHSAPPTSVPQQQHQPPPPTCKHINIDLTNNKRKKMQISVEKH